MNKTKINEEMKSLRRVDLQVDRLVFNTTEAGASAERSHNLLSRYGEPGADTSIRPNNQDYNQAYIDTMFLKNVEIYLKYIMPKKEFKARYGGK